MKTIIDKGTIAGLAFAFVGLGAGLMLEGVKLPQVVQPTAALIVFGDLGALSWSNSPSAQ